MPQVLPEVVREGETEYRQKFAGDYKGDSHRQNCARESHCAKLYPSSSDK